MSGNDQNTDLAKKQLTRLSLSRDTASKSTGSKSRTITVEVKRKKVSLLDKKRAIESGVKISDLVKQEESKPVIVGDLSDVEVDARLKALQNAKKHHKANDEFIDSSEDVSEEPIVDNVEINDSNEDITQENLEEPQKDEANSEAENTNKIELDDSNKKVEKSSKPKHRTEEKASTPSVILRAASYGPKKQIKEFEKPATQNKRVKEKIQEAEPLIETFVETDPNKESYGKIKVKKSIDDFDSVEVSPKKSVKKGISEPRKLTRRVLTRVMDDEEEDRIRSVASYKRAQKKRLMAGQKKQPAKVIRDVIITDTITVGELSNRMAVSSAEVIKSLMKLGVLASINQSIEGDVAEIICSDFGHRPKRVSSSDIEIGVRREDDDPADMVTRPPVVTVMGHVDHGKTSLLDALRKTDVVSGESGGITQHVGAYQIITPYSDSKITFIDTPGHAAFSEMRARGANVTDIVILVVAADDGVNEQTVEAIAHAKASNAAIIVAINKIDKPAADPQRVRNELLNHEIVTEDFGGDIMCVEISAKERLNLDKLVEAILLQAEILELKANPVGQAEGTVVEASMEKGRGITVTALVQRGTLKLGDVLVAGSEFGRIKTMTNSHGKKVKEAGLSCPVEILGFNGVPLAGDEFFVVESEQKAREIADRRKQAQREKEILARNKNSIEFMMSKIAAGETKELPIIIKTDVQGTLEAITGSIGKLSVSGVTAKVVHKAIGDITETDIMLAKTSGAVVIGFNVKSTPQATSMANKEGISISFYSVVYELLDKVESMMKGQLAPTFEEKVLGKAELRVVFSKGKVIKIAGCYVLEGLIRRSNSQVRIYRGNDIVHTGKIDTMKREKDDIKESKAGYECGIIMDGFHDFKEGDIIECFEIVEKAAI